MVESSRSQIAGEFLCPFSTNSNSPDRIALVTGGNRGLGKQMALALAEAGASVALTSRDQGRADQTAEEIAQSLV